ncbi:ABC transporter ATP-binding protein [Radiobacillus sp. PE A8.2]|uniref:ABC transporter ATP-binding protein n=1 Tax=Radiobacillus sp. PE A8.2 TaxID=3380349 RepID=UPI00388FFA2A
MKYIFYFFKQLHEFAGKKLYINVLAMMGTGLLDGIAILLLIPMISLSGIVDMNAAELPFGSLFTIFDSLPTTYALLLILSIYICIAVGQNLLHRHITVRNTIIQQGFLRYLQIQTYTSLLKANWSFFRKTRKSDLIHILSAEIARTNAGTQAFLKLLASFILTTLQIILAFFLSPTITSFVLLCGLVLIFMNRNYLKRSLQLGNRNVELGKAYLAGITDQINGIKDIKSNSLEAPRLGWYHSITKQMKEQHVDFIKLKTTTQAIYKIASAVFIAVFVFAAIQLFAAQVAQLTIIIVIFSRLWPQVTGIQNSMEQIAMTIPSLQAVQALQYQTEEELEFATDSDELIEPVQINDGIRCVNTTFRYDSEKSVYALKDTNIFIPANQITAIAGKSGAGKSTLVDLLMGLNRPETGSVTIDGEPLAGDKIRALRNALSYVPQDPFLFNTSIRENMLLVAPEASEVQIWEAIEFASAADFVRNLAENLDTVIGDRGIKLSGGERQRLVLARAILRKPSVLVLDEATSSLDTENERIIQQAIDRLKGKMTIIIIAHRLSTIKNADQVIVLENGQVIQQGGFQQLSMQTNGLFSKLVNQA